MPGDTHLRELLAEYEPYCKTRAFREGFINLPTNKNLAPYPAGSDDALAYAKGREAAQRYVRRLYPD